MGKRKSKDRDRDYESLRRKVKKLKRELQRVRSPSASSSSEGTGTDIICDRYYHNSDHDEPAPTPPTARSPFYPEIDEIPGEEIENEQMPKNTEVLPTNVETEIAVEVPAEETQPIPLDRDTLQLLGDNPADQNIYGENLHKDITPRWTHILTNGMNKETKADLIKIYLPPENCEYMKAPILNLEIRAALHENNFKKDLYSQSKQHQLASCLAAIGQVLNWALSSKDSLPQAQNIIKPLADAGRLLCDCQYRESQSRRFAIGSALNKETRDAIKNTKIDKYLFGSTLAEHLKSSKAILRSGSEMKAFTTPKAPFKQPSTPQTQRGALNSRGMSRAAAGESRHTPALRRPAPAATSRRGMTAPNTRRSNNHSRQRTRRC